MRMMWFFAVTWSLVLD